MKEQIIKEVLDDLEHGIVTGNIVFQFPEDEHIYSILQQSLKKQLLKKPIRANYINGPSIKIHLGNCSNCQDRVDSGMNYCRGCGQKLDWSGEGENI